MKLHSNSHQPKAINACPWREIEQHYIDLIKQGWQLDPLLQLVRHIMAGELAGRLFAYTSLDRLVIGIYNPMEPHRETLHLNIDAQLQQWSFKYYPKPFHPAEWERQYPLQKGIEKFEGFVKMVKW